MSLLNSLQLCEYYDNLCKLKELRETAIALDDFIYENENIEAGNELVGGIKKERAYLENDINKLHTEIKMKKSDVEQTIAEMDDCISAFAARMHYLDGLDWNLIAYKMKYSSGENLKARVWRNTPIHSVKEKKLPVKKPQTSRNDTITRNQLYKHFYNYEKLEEMAAAKSALEDYLSELSNDGKDANVIKKINYDIMLLNENIDIVKTELTKKQGEIENKFSYIDDYFVKLVARLHFCVGISWPMVVSVTNYKSLDGMKKRVHRAFLKIGI